MLDSLISITTVLAAEAETHAEGSGGIGAIGINGKALLFQIINFAILLFILKKVAYKPILRALESRRKTIEESLKTAKEIEATNQQAAERQEKLIKQARVEADQILNRSQAEAKEQLAKAEADGKKRADRLLADARRHIEEDVIEAKAELKKETLGLVVSATEAIIEERLDPEKDSQLIKKALARGEK